MHRYKIYGAAMPTTAAIAAIATGTAIKTLLQVAPPSDRMMQLIAWGFTIDDPAGADGTIELLQANVAATSLTAHTSADIYRLDPNIPASKVQLGTALTGFNAGAEGSITATRIFDVVKLSSVSAEAAPVLTYAYQFMPDERPYVAVSTFLRVRATTPTSGVDCLPWVVWDE